MKKPAGPMYGSPPTHRFEDRAKRRHSLQEIVGMLGIEPGTPLRFVESLPFSAGDTTAGSESELQAIVIGRKENVDLPMTIERSNYFANALRRAMAGETSKRIVGDLEAYLNDNPDRVWENSWARLPMKTLGSFAKEVLDRDLLADKRQPEAGPRSDLGRFTFHQYGEKWIRIPVSYLIKLSLADVIGSQPNIPERIRQTGKRLLGHFSNDNTSPETYSFHTVHLTPQAGMGAGIARETAKRFLLTQLLVMYANTSFELLSNGQQAIVYSAPHPPVRQRDLNGCISDAFYRELFMSPCLSGWDRGEEKHGYMCLCHQVLSRSQLNAVAKLREAGIVRNNLVVLPNMSNISLANNGTHLSLGSLKLSKALQDEASGLTRADEKTVGDLVIKIVEHFLPLFVGTYSAAPYRLGFTDFHPERALGFLPHELDYTHLRMMWRRWKNKADLKILGHPVTPFGPEWLDRAVSLLFSLKGDFVPDFRLIDYFVSLLSTERSPGLDGKLGNGERLKRDLADMGVFDRKMAVYLLYRLRDMDTMGFSGFEGRHYSLFESFTGDMGRAADLQTLVTALAFKYIAEGRVTHATIPDTPSIESERRQIFFGASIGIPTFFVRKDTESLFLRKIVEGSAGARPSRRYPGYVRVYHHEYRKSLVRTIHEDGWELVQMLGLEKTMDDLSLRLDRPDEHSAAGRLTHSILKELSARSPLQVGAREFNLTAEAYYRNTLRNRHLEEALLLLEEDLRILDSAWTEEKTGYKEEFHFSVQDRGVLDFLHAVREDVLEGTATTQELIGLINLVLITIHHDTREARRALHEPTPPAEGYGPSISRAANW